MTCTPPTGTKPGTLHVLRRDGGGIMLAERSTDQNWVHWALLGEYWMTAAAAAGEGWRYAGPAPALPEAPQTAQEIAREALEELSNTHLTFTGLAIRYAESLRRIAGMKP